MASDFLRFQQDPSLGNALSSMVTDIGNAPGKALSNTHTVEEILALRAKQKRDQAIYDANVAAGTAAANALPTEPPMSTRDVQFQPQGPVNPADPVDPNAVKLGDTMVMPSYPSQEQYLDPKVAEQFKREQPMFRALLQAAPFHGTAEVPGTYAKGAVALGGVPNDPVARQRLGFLEKGTFDSTKGDNYVALRPDGTIAAYMGTSTDGRINNRGEDMQRSAPPNTVVAKAGERSMTTPPTASKNWGIPDGQGGVRPGTSVSSPTQPSPEHIVAGELSQAPRSQSTWGLSDGKGGYIPGSLVTSATPPNSNFVQVGATPAVPAAGTNWVQLDDNDQPIKGSMVTSVTKPEGRFVKAGEAPTKPENQIGTPAARQGYLAEMADKVITQKYQLTPSDAIKLAFALNSEYGLTNKLQADAKGNIVKFTGFQEKDIPQGPHAMLAQAVNAALTPLYSGQDGTATSGQPGQQTAVQPAPVNALNPPPMGTQVVSAGEANQNVANKAQAVGRADIAQQNLETRMGFVDGKPPAILYTPNLAAAVIAEKNNGMIAGRAISMIDPKAPGYLADAKAWVEAVLRLASGAAIRPEEYADYAQIFVPNANDNREQALAKLQRMSDWKQITATSMNADDATKMLMNVSKGDPVFHDMAIKMRNLAQNSGNFQTPFTDPNFGQPKTTGPDPNVVNSILNGGKL